MRFRILTAACLAAASLSAAHAAAHAAAPIVGTQAPGYYRVLVGDIEVTALSDGTIDFPMDTLLIGKPATDIRAAYKAAFQKLPAESSMNQLLINTGSKLVLVDAGAGTVFGPTLGNTVANLRAAGYTPDQVDEVVITHMHADHTGGLAHDGERTFPNAELRIARADLDCRWRTLALSGDRPCHPRERWEGLRIRSRRVLGESRT
jgi:glyoxylase-like metal-dependent hydrolase (beta-lactamase superfamily II)